MRVLDHAIKRAWDWCNDPRHALRARLVQIESERMRLRGNDVKRRQELDEAKRRMVRALELYSLRD